MKIKDANQVVKLYGISNLNKIFNDQIKPNDQIIHAGPIEANTKRNNTIQITTIITKFLSINWSCIKG